MTALATTPRETDERLAELYYETLRLEAKIASQKMSIMHAAGASFYYRGRQRVTDMSFEEAEEIVAAEIQKGTRLLRGSTIQGKDWETGEEWTTLGRLFASYAALEDLRQQAAELGESYTGWSRFFLVTSSKGHIHSSMGCSTCRPSTRYGWLPELSGKAEAEAVAECGPALCTVCFPTAPLEWTEQAITAAAAARRAAG